MKRFLSYLSDVFSNDSVDREKTEKFLVAMDSPEFETLFGTPVSSPTRNENSDITKPPSSDLPPESPSVPDTPIAPDAVSVTNERTPRNTFRASEAPAPTSKKKEDQAVATIESRLASLDEKTLTGLSRALYRWTDNSLTEKQRNIIVKIIEGLAPDDGESLDTRLSRILLLIEARLAEGRIAELAQKEAS